MIEAVIFDWAGTTIDYGCMAPVEAFRKSFLEYKIEVTNEEIREPMGMLKIDHIKAMLAMPRIYDAFYHTYHRAYQEEDVQAIYQSFRTHLMASIGEHTEVKPYVLDTVDALRKQGIKIGSTTGYTDEMMATVVERAAQQGYQPDFWVSPDGVHGLGRPKPFMIYKNMEVLQVYDIRNVIKVGDTIADIEEGKHAGVFTVGVLEGSSLVGLSEDEFRKLSDDEVYQVIKKGKRALLEAGADAVILNMHELLPIVKQFQKHKLHK